MAEVTTVTYKKGEIVPVMIKITSPIELIFSLTSATCEIRYSNGELLAVGEAAVDVVNNRVSYNWDTSEVIYGYYDVMFWIVITTDVGAGPKDFKIASSVLRRYIRQVSALS